MQVKKRKKKAGLVMRVCVFVFAAYITAVLVNLQLNIGSKRRQLEELNVLCEQQRLANTELERVLALGNDEAYIERIAKSELDFAYSDEQILIDTSRN